MPKRGQNHTDAPGRNNPSKSQEITTGTYKKQETYREQAASHEDSGKTAQHGKVPHAGPHAGHSAEAVSALQAGRGASRNGSDSNAHSGRKPDRNHGGQPAEPPGTHQSPSEDDFAADLHPDYLAGQNHGISGADALQGTRNAAEIKELHERLPDFSTDELRQIAILSAGTRLAQGAVYLDLARRERGEFTAMGDMEASERSYLVPKRGVDYVLWNRLTGVTDPSRLDQPG